MAFIVVFSGLLECSYFRRQALALYDLDTENAAGGDA
jgi:hypothetical protein